MRERKQDETANPAQGILPGFKQLQAAYSIKRVTDELDDNLARCAGSRGGGFCFCFDVSRFGASFGPLRGGARPER